MKKLLILLAFLFSSFSSAQKLELKVFASDQGGWPAGALCFFSNNKMTAFEDSLLVHYTCLGGSDIYDEMWLINAREQRLVVRAEMGNLLSTAILIDDVIYMTEFTESETVKIWRDQKGSLTSISIPPELKNSHLHDLASLGHELWFRYTNLSTRDHGEGVFENGQLKILPHRDVGYFYGATSNAEMFIQKVRKAAPPHLVEKFPEEIEIRRAPDFLPVTVIKDQASDPASPYMTLRNHTVLNHHFWAATAQTKDGIVIILGDSLYHRDINLSKNFKDIDYWPGTLSEDGHFIFRGTHRDGRIGLWILKDDVPELILTSHDEVHVGQQKTWVSSHTLFYCAPEYGEGGVYIGVGLDREDGQQIGQGVVKISL
jgi:hypothetical protein